MQLPSYTELSQKNIDEVLALTVSDRQGLTGGEALTRLNSLGKNELEEKRNPWYHIFLRQFRSAFIYLLFGASAIALFQKEYIDAGMIFLFLVLNAVLGFYQEFRAEKALALLKSFVDRKTRVRRDGKEMLISVSAVVSGDIVLLNAGDMLPGDGYFVRADGVTIDESPLTGETEPIAKVADAITMAPKGYYGADNIGFTRTTLMSGDGEVVIFATGKETVIGDIAKHMQDEEHPSAFEEGINKFSKVILKLVLATIPVIFLLNYMIHGDALNIPEFLIFSIALIVSVIPEALPLVMTISLSRGAIILAKQHVVPRRLSAIEDLGSIDVLCTDKTGTITENKLAVAGVYGNEAEVMHYALIVPLSDKDAMSLQNNVFDHALIGRATDAQEQALFGIRRIDELPFDPIRRRGSVLAEFQDKHMLVMRGSPENVYAAAGEPMDALMDEWIKSEGAKGFRVIAIAWKEMDHSVRTLSEEDEKGVHVVGAISFVDPLKASTHAAVMEAKKLGVQVKIITGDAREVGGWVGYEAGIIENVNDVVTGDELDAMTPEEKLIAVEHYNVFARTMPLQKDEIILLLMRKHFVGFLGEGFNDAPALKAAHVGLAVANASDIAQDAADVVLLNPSLMVIIEGIKEGRKIFVNSIKYLRATLASNFGNFYAIALSSLFIPYLPMLPIQILLLNLLSDFPMMTIATDNVDDKELERPKEYQVKGLITVAVVLGVVSTIFDFAFFGYFQQFGESALQTMWFLGSILTELIVVFSIRTRLPFWKARRPGKALTLLSLFAVVLTIALPYIPRTKEIFHFIAPTSHYMIVSGVLILCYFMTTEVVKLAFYRYSKSAAIASR